MTIEISNDRAVGCNAVIKILQYAKTHAHTHANTHTQAHHCPVTATSYFGKLCPQLSLQMPALPLLPQHPSGLCHPLSPCQPIRAFCERLQQEAKLTAHQSTNNHSLQQDVDKALCGYGCSTYGYLWYNYSLITWKHFALIRDQASWQGTHSRDGGRIRHLCFPIVFWKIALMHKTT